MWQNVGPILQSQADLASFSLEVSKKLNLRYHNPPKPIHLRLPGVSGRDGSKRANVVGDEKYNLDQVKQVTKMFNAGTADIGGDD